jgi:hypothetical protein
MGSRLRRKLSDFERFACAGSSVQLIVPKAGQDIGKHHVIPATFWALDKTHLVIGIEDMQDVEHCLGTMKALTGVEYDRAPVEEAWIKRVNRRNHNRPCRGTNLRTKTEPPDRKNAVLSWWYPLRRPQISDRSPNLTKRKETGSLDPSCYDVRCKSSGA